MNAHATDAEFERRFGGLRRLYGVAAAQRVFDAHVCVVGVGGVGSWVAEALARSGVGHLTLVDMDHVAESNINRQVHALTATVGASKISAMQDRIAQINPYATVRLIDDFVSPSNWATYWRTWADEGRVPDAVVDACDDMSAKLTMCVHARHVRVPHVVVGAAGGKWLAHGIEVNDLSVVTHDPLLAKLRYQLRRVHGAPRQGTMGVTCVFSREPVRPPDASCALESADGSLNCHGFGSSVAVTSAMGMVAAAHVMNALAGVVQRRSTKKR